MTVKLRYKEPKETESKLLTIGLIDKGTAIENASDNLKFASSVAEFGLLMRDSRYKNSANFANVSKLAESAKGDDLKNYRNEFIELVSKSKQLKNRG